ncbi:hypothetical protein AB0X74_04565 [Kurthia gibsonii]|uniref:hypothetical protein n=1 Tax=Kurthia gibsonii TaxID=33946 RepID=UPI003F281A73
MFFVIIAAYLNALAIADNMLITENFLEKSQQPNSVKIIDILGNLKVIDWLSTGDFKYIKSASETKILANDIIHCLQIK